MLCLFFVYYINALIIFFINRSISGFIRLFIFRSVFESSGCEYGKKQTGWSLKCDDVVFTRKLIQPHYCVRKTGIPADIFC